MSLFRLGVDEQRRLGSILQYSSFPCRRNLLLGYCTRNMGGCFFLGGGRVLVQHNTPQENARDWGGVRESRRVEVAVLM